MAATGATFSASELLPVRHGACRLPPGIRCVGCVVNTKKFRLVAAVLSAAIFASAAWEGAALSQPADLPADKRTKLEKYLTSRGAYDLVQRERGRVLFIDIRTRAEIATVGMAHDVDGYVPYVEFNEFWEWDDKAGRFKLELNQRFGQVVEQLLSKKGLSRNDKVVLICRSGDRSARAVNLLADLGYTNVYSVVDGFEGDLTPEGRREVNGWKNSLLPWSYELDKSKIYLSN